MKRLQGTPPILVPSQVLYVFDWVLFAQESGFFRPTGIALPSVLEAALGRAAVEDDNSMNLSNIIIAEVGRAV